MRRSRFSGPVDLLPNLSAGKVRAARSRLCFSKEDADAIAPLVKDLPGLGLRATVEALQKGEWLVQVEGEMNLAAAESVLRALKDSGVKTVAYRKRLFGNADEAAASTLFTQLFEALGAGEQLTFDTFFEAAQSNVQLLRGGEETLRPLFNSLCDEHGVPRYSTSHIFGDADEAAASALFTQLSEALGAGEKLTFGTFFEAAQSDVQLLRWSDGPLRPFFNSLCDARGINRRTNKVYSADTAAADEANAKSILDELVKQQPHKKRPSNAAFLQVAKGVLPEKKLKEIYKAFFKIPELPSKKRTKEQPSWSSLTDNQVEACDALFWSIRKDTPYFTSEVFIDAAQRSKLLPGLSKEADGGPLRAALAARHEFLYHGGGGAGKKSQERRLGQLAIVGFRCQLLLFALFVPLALLVDTPGYENNNFR